MEILRWIGDETALMEFASSLSTLVLLLIIFGCIMLLCRGASWMVDGVVGLAQRTGLPHVVIGATVVSLGTTMPEAIVSVMAAFTGNPGLALGNGVGSIIADTGLIFGLVCFLAAVPMNRFILNRTGWVQVGTATLLVAIAVLALLTAEEGEEPFLQQWVGFLFIAMLALYLYLTYVWAKQGGELVADKKKVSAEPKPLWKCWILLVGGLLLVIVGARILIPCASEVAVRLGVPEDVIAATMIALGTSLPELITAIASVKKGHPGIMVGNVVGADVLNCLFVIGAAACTRPLAIPNTFYTFHFPAMLIILFSFRIFIGMNRDGKFRRWQGAWLLLIYAVYIILQYTLNLGSPEGG